MIFLNMKRRLFEKSNDVFSSCATLSKCQKNLILPTKLEPKWFLSIVSAQNFSVMSWCIPQKFLPTNFITKRILHLSVSKFTRIRWCDMTEVSADNFETKKELIICHVSNSCWYGVPTSQKFLPTLKHKRFSQMFWNFSPYVDVKMSEEKI